MANGGVFINRSVVRQAIGSSLALAMPSAQAVHLFQRSKLSGLLTVVRLFSNGSNRPMMAAQGVRSELAFIAQLWVLYNSPTAPAWSEEQAEDRLDQLEFELATWMAANNDAPDALWQAAAVSGIRYAGQSIIGTMPLSGESYLVEDIPLVAEVYG